MKQRQNQRDKDNSPVTLSLEDTTGIKKERRVTHIQKTSSGRSSYSNHPVSSKIFNTKHVRIPIILDSS